MTIESNPVGSINTVLVEPEFNKKDLGKLLGSQVSRKEINGFISKLHKMPLGERKEFLLKIESLAAQKHLPAMEAQKEILQNSRLFKAASEAYGEIVREAIQKSDASSRTMDPVMELSDFALLLGSKNQKTQKALGDYLQTKSGVREYFLEIKKEYSEKSRVLMNHKEATTADKLRVVNEKFREEVKKYSEETLLPTQLLVVRLDQLDRLMRPKGLGSVRQALDNRIQIASKQDQGKTRDYTPPVSLNIYTDAKPVIAQRNLNIKSSTGSGVKSHFNSFASSVKNFFNSFRLPSFKLPSWLPGARSPGFEMPTLKKLDDPSRASNPNLKVPAWSVSQSLEVPNLDVDKTGSEPLSQLSQDTGLYEVSSTVTQPELSAYEKRKQDLEAYSFVSNDKHDDEKSVSESELLSVTEKSEPPKLNSFITDGHRKMTYKETGDDQSAFFS